MRKSTAVISIAVMSIATAITMMPVDAEEPSTMPVVYDIEPVMQADEAAEASAWLIEHGVNVPESIEWECEAAGATKHVSPELLEAIAWVESRYKADAQSGAYVGLMQMHRTIHADRLAAYGTDVFDPHASIWAAADLIADLGEEYAIDGEPADAAVILAAYHGEDDLYKATPSRYVRSILEVAERLERAHGK